MHLEQRRLDQPIEARARDVPVHPERGSKIVHRDRPSRRAREEQGLPQPGIADCLKAVHFSNTIVSVDRTASSASRAFGHRLAGLTSDVGLTTPRPGLRPTIKAARDAGGAATVSSICQTLPRR